MYEPARMDHQQRRNDPMRDYMIVQEAPANFAPVQAQAVDLDEMDEEEEEEGEQEFFIFRKSGYFEN